MKRVLVIGSPGAGKSTFARSLGALTGLPTIHLDAEFHLPGWQDPDRDAWNAKLDTMLARDSWIMDGNYGGTMSKRMLRADTVFWLDYATPLCLWRAVKRVVTGYGKVRPDAAPGCPERFEPDFLLYILNFRRSREAAIEARFDQFGGTLHRFHRPQQAEAFLRRLA